MDEIVTYLCCDSLLDSLNVFIQTSHWCLNFDLAAGKLESFVVGFKISFAYWEQNTFF